MGGWREGLTRFGQRRGAFGAQRSIFFIYIFMLWPKARRLRRPKADFFHTFSCFGQRRGAFGAKRLILKTPLDFGPPTSRPHLPKPFRQAFPPPGCLPGAFREPSGTLPDPHRDTPVTSFGTPPTDLPRNLAARSVRMPRPVSNGRFRVGGCPEGHRIFWIFGLRGRVCAFPGVLLAPPDPPGPRA